MSFMEITKEMLNLAFTEKGDRAYKTSGSYCLDYFALIGGMRFNYTHALNNFMKAYKEDPILAIKILFFARDIRAGLGERNIFRFTFNMLCNIAPNVAKQVLSYVPTYGRYDDLFSAFDTPVKSEVVALIKNQLELDVKAKEENKPISLLAKWMPSINTSSFETRVLAKKLASSLDMSNEVYRKTLASLRKGIIIENNLRTKDYTFNYEQVPGGAMFKYKNAFTKNDRERYFQYLDEVNKGTKKMNSSTVFPYQIIRKLEYHHNPYVKEGYEDITKEELFSLNTIWNSFPREGISSKTIVVRDGSGSMLDHQIVSANSVASSLAILFAERLEGEFKNKFITFSAHPKLVEIEGETIAEKYASLAVHNDYSTTNVGGVYDLILKVYSNSKFKKEDELDRIVIISDMEFDVVEDEVTSYEFYKNKFEQAGFKLPEVVFWNVRARDTHLPVTMSEENVKLVSGASASIIDMVTKNESKTPYQMMLECLEKYSCFDSLVID